MRKENYVELKGKVTNSSWEKDNVFYYYNFILKTEHFDINCVYRSYVKTDYDFEGEIVYVEGELFRKKKNDNMFTQVNVTKIEGE